MLWDLEPDTYYSRSEEMVEYVRASVSPGSVVLLHVETSPRREGRKALRQMIPDLLARGYRFVVLSELMESGRVSS